MLHHASFNARDPETVARALARMLKAQVVRAPTPPFPAESWFVCSGDGKGSYLEVLPAGNVFDRDARFGVRTASGADPASGAHVLVSSPLSAAELEAEAAAAGWSTEIADARLFKVLKVWVENTTLVEFLPPEMSEAYLETFGTAGLATLDDKLRRLEAPPS